MKIVQFRYFQAVCKSMSFTKAAEELYVSQPAVSTAIREMEDEFGVRLFNRQNSSLSLTEEGCWLLEKCGSLLKEFDSIEAHLHSLSTQHNYLRVGIAPMIGNYYFFTTLHSFMKKFPSAKTEIVEAGSLELREAVMNNAVDIGVVILNDLPPNKCNILKLYDCELVFCVSKEHRLASRKAISFAELSKEKIILLKEDSYQNTLIKSKFKEANSELNILLHSNQLSSVKKMIYQGNCGAFLFKAVADDDFNLISISLDQRLFLEAGLVWLKNQKVYPDMQNFINYVKQNTSR